MTKPAVNSNFSKSKGQAIFEYTLLAICLCVIALRTTITETPTTQSTILPANVNDNVYSLILSAVLIFSFVCWFIWSFCSKRFLYRFTGMEIGLCLFITAAVIAGLAAANKRAAITGSVTMLAPVLMAVLLVQILDSQSKIKLLLTVIAALGVVSAYQCAEQFFSSNRMMIEQYEQAPQTLLEPLGIQPGSFAQMLFEHRLYSKGVRSFFTTSNSAGSFAMLASFAAIALFLEEFRNRKFCASGFRRLLACGLAVVIVIFGLAITQSKGAIIASLIAAAMFIAYLLFGNWLNRHKKTILIAGLLLALAGGCLIVQYGLTHNRLPGGNSMLVRWQYWQASAKMYADYPLTGVGPGNFATSYTRYQPPEALETISDPHHFLLRSLTRYGPLGLVGFLALVFIPLWTASANHELPRTNTKLKTQVEPALKKLAVPFVIVISAVLLLVRPIITPLTNGAAADVMVYAIFVLYVAPVVAFAVGFWLLTTPLYEPRATAQSLRSTPHGAVTNITTAALFCAVLGLLIHNLIDFAIFEPGVFTVFWAITACLIAMDFQRKSRPQFVLRPAVFVKMSAAAGGLVLIWAYFNYALVPVAKAGEDTGRAMRQPEYVHRLLDRAAETDRLDPAAPYLNGRIYLQRYRQTGKMQPALLKQAAECFLAAVKRDKADFKNYEKLSEVYNLLAEASSRQEKTDWLNKAFDSAWRAVERYPGSARLRVKLAEIAEQLDKTDIAIENYKEAIETEDSYRAQFRIMYPGREIFSRLGEEKYKLAKKQVEKLSKQSKP